MEELSKKLEDLIQWYYYHEPHIVDVDQRLRFYNDAISAMIELFVMLVDDYNRKKENSPQLLIPKGIKLHGDFKL